MLELEGLYVEVGKRKEIAILGQLYGIFFRHGYESGGDECFFYRIDLSFERMNILFCKPILYQLISM